MNPFDASSTPLYDCGNRYKLDRPERCQLYAGIALIPRNPKFSIGYRCQNCYLKEMESEGISYDDPYSVGQGGLFAVPIDELPIWEVMLA